MIRLVFAIIVGFVVFVLAYIWNVPRLGFAPSSTASLSWTAPERDADGNVLDDLSYYKVYWSQDLQNKSVNVEQTTEVLKEFTDLSPGVWYFWVSAVDESGNESEIVGPVEKRLGETGV